MKDLELRNRVIAAIGCTDENITTFCHRAAELDSARRLAMEDSELPLGDTPHWPRRLIADRRQAGAGDPRRGPVSREVLSDVAGEFARCTGITVMDEAAMRSLADLVVQSLLHLDRARAGRRQRHKRCQAAIAAERAAAAMPPATGARLTWSDGLALTSPSDRTWWHHFGAYIRTWRAPVVPAGVADTVCMRVLDAANILNSRAVGIRGRDPLRAALEYYNGPGPNHSRPFAVAIVSCASRHAHRDRVDPLVDWGWVVVLEEGAAEGADDDAFIEIARTRAVLAVTNDKLVDRIVQSANAGDDDEYATDVQLVSADRVGYTFHQGAFVPRDPQYTLEMAEAFRLDYRGERGNADDTAWRRAFLEHRMEAARQRREQDGGKALARWRSINPGGSPHLTGQRRLMKSLGCSERGLADWVAAFAHKPICTERKPVCTSHAIPSQESAGPGRSLLQRLLRRHAAECDVEELSAIYADFAEWDWPFASTLEEEDWDVTPTDIVTWVLRPMLRARTRDYAAAMAAVSKAGAPDWAAVRKTAVPCFVCQEPEARNHTRAHKCKPSVPVCCRACAVKYGSRGLLEGYA